MRFMQDKVKLLAAHETVKDSLETDIKIMSLSGMEELNSLFTTKKDALVRD